MRIRCKIISVILKWQGRDGVGGNLIDATVVLSSSVDGDGRAVNVVLWQYEPLMTFELRGIRQDIALTLVPGADYYVDINSVAAPVVEVVGQI